MSIKHRVTGLKKIRLNITKTKAEIAAGARFGVNEAGHIVKSASEDLTSIDTGELIQSSFNLPRGTTARPKAVVGYRAKYARIVHEKHNDTNWHRAGAENRFLEKAVVRNTTKIFNAIKNAIIGGFS